jgi:alkylation response protein AidB-like acyl-CoA dehydrogenase
MFLAPEGHELSIADAAGKFLLDLIPASRLHRPGAADADASVRAKLGEFGWFGLAVAEAQGGSGLSAVEHALLFREVGRQIGPIDVLTQSLAALTASDDDGLRATLLAGETGVALAVREPAGLRLLGAPDASLALLADPDGARLVRLAPGAGAIVPSLDPATSMRSLREEPGPAVAAASGPDIWRMGQVGAAAMLVGIAEQALDAIVAYAKVRETFGRPIGAYQAVRHPCADMAVRAEAARCQLWYAAAALKEGRADAPDHLNAAKHLANQAAVTNADLNIQLHGGIGVTDEHDAHLLLKHALLLVRIFGSKRQLLTQLLHAGQEG